MIKKRRGEKKGEKRKNEKQKKKKEKHPTLSFSSSILLFFIAIFSALVGLVGGVGSGGACFGTRMYIPDNR